MLMLWLRLADWALTWKRRGAFARGEPVSPWRHAICSVALRLAKVAS